MDNVRIVQKNLVFVSGLPGSIADADVNFMISSSFSKPINFLAGMEK